MQTVREWEKGRLMHGLYSAKQFIINVSFRMYHLPPRSSLGAVGYLQNFSSI